jgi:hypothetical protein
MDATDGYVLHGSPVWREKSDFIINARLSPSESPKRFEQLFVRRIEERQFELCCIPFFLFDVALGDVVETGTTGDTRYELLRVIRPSGRWVFRVWFGESFQPRDDVELELIALGATLERYSLNLLGVDAEDEQQAQTIADALYERQLAGQLLYDTGKS